RSFTSQFKAEVVLEILAGLKSLPDNCTAAQAKARTHCPLEGHRSRRSRNPLSGLGSTGPGPGPHRRTGSDGRTPHHGAGSCKKGLDLAPFDPEARRGVVLRLAAEYPVRLICQAMGWPRSSVYRGPISAARTGPTLQP